MGVWIVLINCLVLFILFLVLFLLVMLWWLCVFLELLKFFFVDIDWLVWVDLLFFLLMMMIFLLVGWGVDVVVMDLVLEVFDRVFKVVVVLFVEVVFLGSLNGNCIIKWDFLFGLDLSWSWLFMFCKICVIIVSFNLRVLFFFGFFLLWVFLSGLNILLFLFVEICLRFLNKVLSWVLFIFEFVFCIMILIWIWCLRSLVRYSLILIWLVDVCCMVFVVMLVIVCWMWCWFLYMNFGSLGCLMNLYLMFFCLVLFLKGFVFFWM